MNRRNRSLGITLGVLGFVAISCGPGRELHAQGSFTVQLAEDAEILSTSRVLIEAANRLELIWPGFWRADQPFVLFEPGRAAFLFSRVEPDPPFQRVSIPEIPVLNDRTYGTRETVQGLSTSRGLYGFNSRFQWGAVSGPSMQITDSIAMTIEGLIHEAFHGFQDGRFEFQPKNQYLFVESVFHSDPKYIALAEIERRLLADALELDGTVRVHKLEEYVAVRSFREADIPEGIVRSERIQETYEGTAQYVGQMGVSIALGRDGGDMTRRIQEALRTPIELVSWEPDLSLQDQWRWLHWWRLYQTGAAVSLLLDQLAPDWKGQVEAGLPIHEMLANVLMADSSTVVDVERVLAQHEYEVVLEASRAASERGSWPVLEP